MFLSSGVPPLLNEFVFRQNLRWTDHVVDVNVGQFDALERVTVTVHLLSESI